MNGWLAVSVFVASAPMDTPFPFGVISASFSRLRSISSVGRSTSSFIRSRRLVPPARNFACAFAATARPASSGLLARTYLNGLIGRLPAADARRLLLVRELPCPRALGARMHVLDR